MPKFLKRVDKTFDIGLRWSAAYVVLSGGLSWLAKQLKVFGDIGWPEAIFIGIIIAALSFIGIAAILAGWRYFKPLGRFDDKPKKPNREWAIGIATMSIRDIGCAISGVTPQQFDESPRAVAIANQIRSRVNDGWIPTAGEESADNSQISVTIVGQPDFETKRVALNAMINVRRVKGDSADKSWDFSWYEEKPKKPAARRGQAVVIKR